MTADVGMKCEPERIFRREKILLPDGSASIYAG
jgi:hypothetical protein